MQNNETDKKTDTWSVYSAHKDAKHKAYLESWNSWLSENLGKPCIQNSFGHPCTGVYEQSLDDIEHRRFEALTCSVCGGKLITFTFKEYVINKYQTLKGEIKALQSSVEFHRTEIQRIKASIKENEEAIKEKRQEIDAWRDFPKSLRYHKRRF